MGQLTVTYLTDAHRACAQRITQNMRDCGFDEVFTDAVGNVVGRYHPAPAGANEPAPGRPKLASAPSGGSEPHAVGSVGARYLMTGSHYDTVRNGG
jgi:N-carbamoyl-L-amino-acid hydrolase